MPLFGACGAALFRAPVVIVVGTAEEVRRWRRGVRRRVLRGWSGYEGILVGRAGRNGHAFGDGGYMVLLRWGQHRFWRGWDCVRKVGRPWRSNPGRLGRRVIVRSLVACAFAWRFARGGSAR